MTSKPLSLETVKQEVDQLAAQVNKNSKAIVDTGRHVMQMEVDKERSSLGKLRLDSRESRIPHTESDDEEEDPVRGKSANGSFGSEDIIDLVTELQGQLDILDDRSVRRTANAFVTSDDDPIAPLPGRDGSPPAETGEEEHIFPKTFGEFKNMKDGEVEFWSRWYELLPPDEQELQDILKRAGTSMQEMGVDKQEIAQVSEQERDGNFDSLARFLGLRHRRVKGAW